VPDTTKSPCIDTGDPASALDPDSTRRDMGCFYFNQLSVPPPVDVTLTPLSPPIAIPAAGGTYSYTAAAHNTTASLQAFCAWCKIKYPNGTWTGYVLGPLNLNIPASLTVSRNRNQSVPGSWAAGNYQHWGWTAPAGTFNAYDSSFFAWTKSGVDLNSPLKSWAGGGDPFPGEQPQAVFIPSGLQVAISPNPFNPTTAISYELRAASRVSLKVYDSAGRLVTTLVNGRQETGQHQISFDGSNLAAGVYFYRLTAGENVASGKMMLLK
jgi:hypothetical protein